MTYIPAMVAKRRLLIPHKQDSHARPPAEADKELERSGVTGNHVSCEGVDWMLTQES